MNSKNAPNPAFYLLLLLIAFQALSGLSGGILLVYDPSGTILNLPLSLLQRSPFDSYLIPGLILFTILGVVPAIIFGRLLSNKKQARFESLLTGISLLIWIGVEILMIGYQSNPPLQLIYGIVGILICLTSALPSVKHRLAH